MIASFVIALREGIEAALIIGIIIAYLTKNQQSQYNKQVYLGSGLAIAASIFVAIGFELLVGGFTGVKEEVFEGLVSLMAVVVLVYMIFWMNQNSRGLKSGLYEQIDVAITQKQLYSLVSLAFFSVFREGLETVLFLSGVRFATESMQDTLIGGILGLLTATTLGYLIIRGSIQLNLHEFFRITSIALLIFAAGIFAFGIHELIEVGLLPAGLNGERLYNISHILNDTDAVGSLLRALVGYNDNPFLLEAVAYIAFWVIIGFALIWLNRRASASLQSEEAPFA